MSLWMQNIEKWKMFCAILIMKIIVFYTFHPAYCVWNTHENRNRFESILSQSAALHSFSKWVLCVLCYALKVIKSHEMIDVIISINGNMTKNFTHPKVWKSIFCSKTTIKKTKNIQFSCSLSQVLLKSCFFIRFF